MVNHKVTDPAGNLQGGNCLPRKEVGQELLERAGGNVSSRFKTLVSLRSTELHP